MAYATVAQLRQYLAQVPEYAQQRVTLTGIPTGGTFTLTYEGETTAAIAYDATATAVQTALVALAAIGSGKARVGGPAGGPWEVVLSAGNDASPLSGDGSGLTGGTSPDVSIEPATDDLLETILERATDIVNEALGFAFEGYSSSEKIIFAERSRWLTLPHYQAGTITSLEDYDRVESYTEGDEYEVDDDNHRYLYKNDGSYAAHGSLSTSSYYAHTSNYWKYRRYRVTAAWGYGDPPPALVEVTIEVAVNIWRAKDRGLFTDVIGVETSPGAGAVVGYQGAMTNQQKMVVSGIRDQYRERVM
jgi:hypothetical protein